MTVVIENVVETSEMCPNQFEGTANGHSFYFRARHGHWTLQVAPKVGQDACIDGEYVVEGDHPRAGWWESAEARSVLESAIHQADTLGVLRAW